MQQRTEAHDSLDDFPTPPWATRALLHFLIGKKLLRIGGRTFGDMTAWEPCANRGYMVKPLQEMFGKVIASDIFDYGMGYAQHDVLMPYTPHHSSVPVDWFITNPPFRLAEQIILQGLEIATQGVAVLVRSAFEEGIDRYEKLFCNAPPTLLGVFTERVIMHKGVLRDPSKLYWNPQGRNPDTGEKTGAFQKPSTATSYKWMVWSKHHDPMPQIWIPPCRRQLERPGDYPNV
jgi:hypothetical protein